MSLLSDLADRFILRPSTRPIDPGENECFLIHSSKKIKIETYRSEVGPQHASLEADPQNHLVVMKFPGTSGRAERSSVHPSEMLAGDDSIFASSLIFTLNHRGYGGSTGPASLSNFVSTLHLFCSHVSNHFPDSKVLITGNSLGCLSALYCAANCKCNGLLLRNPPPLQELIRRRLRYKLLSFGFNRLIASQVPNELCALQNAKRVTCPGLFVSSEYDRVVPPEYQDLVFGSYAGPKKRFLVKGADHHHRIQDNQKAEYEEAIAWLGEQID